MINNSTPGDGSDAIELFGEIYLKYQKRILELISMEAFDALIDYIKQAQKKTRDDHWLMMQLALAYLFKQDYQKTHKALRDAMILHDDCIMVPYLSGHLFLQKGEWTKAASLFQIVIDAGVEAIYNYSSCLCCGEEHQAHSIVADSNFLLSECYNYLGCKEQAVFHRNLHRKAVSEGVRSIYDPETTIDDED
ncbi:hypothetical protein WBG78_07285 [Chryseolinea sp. T2]|uniref:tetratricopeptide repeat protein n=1 Tax=Chryseolinea sp. T2 TaxID=3129255 RepID=UPI003077D44A